ncbi:hypothetical protein FVE85_7398 [Porphyridium purpureum]|uniref:Uncharacterized protein n=1 Tax=Porphyridium purpureum TaxID=35688 RepID=A0A5J4ZAL7_PORPP|nr:hypothetical protein FVE85_7398 [Porphyridium purpureum]|eukprot:POR1250..scf295_1
MARNKRAKEQERGDEVRKRLGFEGGEQDAGEGAKQNDGQPVLVVEAPLAASESLPEQLAGAGMEEVVDVSVKMKEEQGGEPTVQMAVTMPTTMPKTALQRQDQVGMDARSDEEEGAGDKEEELEPEAETEAEQGNEQDQDSNLNAPAMPRKRSQGFKVCPSCKYHNAVAVAECRECNHVFYVKKGLQIAKRECPQCQWSNKVTSKTCRSCGFSFRQQTEQKKAIHKSLAKAIKDGAKPGSNTAPQYYQLGPAFNGL